MNAKIIIPVLLGLALPALAQNSQSPSITKSPDPSAIMRDDPYLHPSDLLVEKDASTVQLGNSDYVITGPVIEGINQSPAAVARPPLWKRAVMFPVNMVTPLPMARPPGTGAYFKWRSDGTQPWTAIATGARPTTDDPAITHEAVPLITVGR